jgi:hypothetical protein
VRLDAATASALITFATATGQSVPDLVAAGVSIGINECSRGERRMLAAARTFGLPRADQTA